MILKPRYSNSRTLVYKPEVKGAGIGSVLLDGGVGGQSSYSSVQDYKKTTSKGRGLEGLGSSALGEKLSKLVIKQPPSKKQESIKFNL